MAMPEGKKTQNPFNMFRRIMQPGGNIKSRNIQGNKPFHYHPKTYPPIKGKINS